MKYEDFITQRKLLGPEWKSDNESFEAGIGIAIVCSYLANVKPTVEEMSKHLDVPVAVLSVPFKRLLYSGVFSKKFNARQDVELLGKGINDTNSCLDLISANDVVRNAWCIIAGISAGHIFRSIDKRDNLA